MQNLFVEKIREYGDKKSKAGGKLVDANKATEAELQAELDKVIKENPLLCYWKFIHIKGKVISTYRVFQ